MKKVILLAACLISLTTVNAQEKAATTNTQQRDAKPKMTDAERAQKRTDEISAKLTLTAEQKVKVYDYALTQAKKESEIKAKPITEQSREQKQTEIRTAHKEFEQNVRSVLTPEQLEKEKAERKEKHAEKAEHRAQTDKAVETK